MYSNKGVCYQNAPLPQQNPTMTDSDRSGLWDTVLPSFCPRITPVSEFAERRHFSGRAKACEEFSLRTLWDWGGWMGGCSPRRSRRPAGRIPQQSATTLPQVHLPYPRPRYTAHTLTFTTAPPPHCKSTAPSAVRFTHQRQPQQAR